MRKDFFICSSYLFNFIFISKGNSITSYTKTIEREMEKEDNVWLVSYYEFEK